MRQTTVSFSWGRVKRGREGLAGVWLRTSLTEISAEEWEALVH